LLIDQNVNALRGDDNAIALQRRLIERLNSVDNAADLGNLVGIGGENSDDGREVNGLKNIALSVSSRQRSWHDQRW
jgi:hypothetical protein